MSLKNLWTMNIDETLVADKLKNVFKESDYEIFMPLNAQMKDIDLLLVKLSNYKAYSIQVKGSRTYEPKVIETKRYGNGSAAWFSIPRNSMVDTQNKVSCFVFVLHSFSDTENKKAISISYLVVPIKDLVKITEKKQMRKDDFYHFSIWIDAKDKRAFDFNNPGSNVIELSKYLDNWDLLLKS
ncbi:MAG TPA: hypothetical protein VGF75_04975 [Candidatus Saccharimonadales bacterium]|jgi:hypothetical protein